MFCVGFEPTIPASERTKTVNDLGYSATVTGCPGRFTPGTHWTGGLPGPTAGQGSVKKRKVLPLPGIKPRLSSPQPVALPTELSRLLHMAQ
jgi:hypothetical protein